MMYQKIPTNLITGFLGVGKTTALLHILKTKPADERWALIINEFGAVSIDHTPFAEADQNGLMVKEVAGGCICCSANLPMQTTLNLVIRQLKPHRILIEPTGMGHPENILDMLRSQFLANVLDVQATICLVDPRQWNTEKYRNHETFIDQITLADVLIANKTDLAGEDLTNDFLDWAADLFPPKTIVKAVQNGTILTEWLDVKSLSERKALHHSHSHDHDHHSTEPELTTPQGVDVVRRESHGLGCYGVGWVFSSEVVFDLNKLKKWVTTNGQMTRIKGAFRTGKDWVFLNVVRGEYTVSHLAYRRDSRVEVLSDSPIAWKTVEEGLKNCLLFN
jgi:G3E family GTPase